MSYLIAVFCRNTPLRLFLGGKGGPFEKKRLDCIIFR